MTGTGDADLYVRAGSAPTATQYECRPFKLGSTEQCTIALAKPTVIHVMIRGGSAQTSTYSLTVRPKPSS